MDQLTPPDLDQCQCEHKPGSFMTFGPREWVRCTNKADFIATEVELGENGQIGSMSLCSDCAKQVVKQMGDSVFLVEIREECH